MKKVYKRQFKEKSAKDIVEKFFDENFLKYWNDDGPEEEYFKMIKTLLKYISNDLNDVIEDDTDSFSSKSKKIAKKLLSSSVKKF